MTTIVHATRSDELLGLIPALAGYTPRQSLVLLPFEGSRTHGAVRVDLPGDDTDLDVYVAELIGLVCRIPAADGLAVAVYTDEALTGTPPFSTLIEALQDRAEACGLGIVAALCIGSDAWADLRGDAAQRRPLSEIVVAEVPGMGDVIGDQESGAALPEIDEREREGVAQAVAALDRVLEEGAGETPEERMHPQALEALAHLDDLPAFFEQLLERPESPEPFETAALAWCLNRPLLRDVALVQWARSRKQGALALGAQIAFVDQDAPVPDSLARVLLGGGRRPDPDRLAIALTLARGVAARVPETARVGPLVAAAWLAWAHGRSTHAAAYLDEALSIDPEHSMAHLVRTLVEAAILPDWAFTPRAEAT